MLIESISIIGSTHRPVEKVALIVIKCKRSLEGNRLLIAQHESVAPHVRKYLKKLLRDANRQNVSVDFFAKKKSFNFIPNRTASSEASLANRAHVYSRSPLYQFN